MAVVSDPVQVGYVCALEEPQAADAKLTGAKAAAIASSRAQGLPVIPGFAATTRAHADYLSAGRTFPSGLEEALRRAWTEFTDDGKVRLVVRSSSTVEDVASSSMAGRFRSVLDVRGFDAFLDAVAEVWASADRVSEGPEPSPMGVLVQRHLDPNRSGVMFGVDPVTGDRATIAVDAVAGGPDKLVSGQVSAQHYVLSRRGRLLSVDHQPVHLVHPTHRHGHQLLHARDLLALAGLARATEGVFGRPQDVEWAITDDGELWLLQSRPVTATAAVAPASGPILGPGPLAETFPDPLGDLEVDLWVGPLRAGVVDAMQETRAVQASRISGSPVVTTVNGRVAADLELFGYVRTRSALGPLDPRPGFRQMRAAWRTGAVRAALASRVAAQVAQVDEWLSSADPRSGNDEDLVLLLEEAVKALRGLHHSEALAGTLLSPATRTAAALALQILGSPDVSMSDRGLLRRHPVLLSLIPPTLRGRPEIPPGMPAPTKAPDRPEATIAEPLAEREQLRLRARWTQELTVYASRELGRRLSERGVFEHTADIGLLQLSELRALVVDGAAPPDLDERRGHDLALAFMPPLPAQFRLSAEGEVVPARKTANPGFGTPAGGGRGVGNVSHGSVNRPPSPGDVLVVRTLEPGLAAWLPGLAGLVAETGASLSHLAILAREYGVPTVVSVHDALARFSPGTRVLVDGATGEVRSVEQEEES